MTACIWVYIAADHPLPVIPFSRDDPGLHVDPISSSDSSMAPDEVLRRWISKRHIYRAGSHLGCGCGFGFCDRKLRLLLKTLGLRRLLRVWGFPSLRRLWQSWEVARNSEGFRRSSFQLADYLEQAVRTGDVEVLVCYLDEEGDPPRPRREVTPAYFRGSAVWYGTSLDLEKGDFFLVRSG